LDFESVGEIVSRKRGLSVHILGDSQTFCWIVQFGKKWATLEALNSFRRRLKAIMKSLLDVVKP
jgi:hypothetical protein